MHTRQEFIGATEHGCAEANDLAPSMAASAAIALSEVVSPDEKTVYSAVSRFFLPGDRRAPFVARTIFVKSQERSTLRP
ncbi:MAG: hypothetical protein ACLSVD_18465 [Eggerthellaceae bacterium]